MAAGKNILWVMCDQLRFDDLSCYGHPRLKTPKIDALAARGVRFTRAYVQSPIRGAPAHELSYGPLCWPHTAVPIGVSSGPIGATVQVATRGREPWHG